MASLQRRSSGRYLLSFRFQGRQYQRSIETDDEEQASHVRRNVEYRLKHLREGTLRLPDGAASDDLWAVLLHGRLPEVPAKLIHELSLEVAAKRYLMSYPIGSKEPETLNTERVHTRNFLRILGKATALHSISPSDIERYITKRLTEKGLHRGTIKPDTILKELQTFRLIWKFAKQNGNVFTECPVDGVKRPKRHIKPPFQTWEQIVSSIKRGGLTDGQIAELWDGLFLREIEVARFLEHVRIVSEPLTRFPYIYPVLCFCAYTGARRSEMFRCRIEDVADGWITLREKKRDRDAQFSYRHVPLNSELAITLTAWLRNHPGGPFLFCKNSGKPLDDRTAREAFAAVTKNSDWSVLRGFHVLRHSLASNLARSGRVSQSEIDQIMGHQTLEMRLRYLHHYPEDARRAVDSVSYKALPS